MTGLDSFDPQRTVLSPQYRAQLLGSLAAGAHYDLVVIGAGVTGTGVALDAASRGLSVLIVEAQDLAFGTSRWSSKLAHGGLRYLASGNVGIAQRSAVERGALMETIAPHLTRALPQVVAVDNFSPLSFVPRLGFFAGDILRIAAGTSSHTLPRSRTVSAKKVKQLCPGASDAVKFGFVNYDGQLIDDARLVTALARTAAGYGADVLTHAKADIAPGRDDGLKSVTLTRTHATEGEPEWPAEGIQVKAAGVINATGVWAGDIEDDVSVTPSRGTHLVVDAEKLGNPQGALTVAVPGSVNRFCFILPTQLGRCYIGLTDEAAEFEDIPHAPESDIEWILNVVNHGLKTQLTADDVRGAFAGLRPLVQLRGAVAKAASDSTADLSREHLIVHKDGVVTVTGGKLTEYRLMAQQAVDRALEEQEIRRRIDGTPGDCETKKIALVGANAERSPQGASQIAAAHVVTSALSQSLVARFGAEARNVLAESRIQDGEQQVGGLDITRAEISYAVTHEGAVTVDDILDRRTRIGLVPEDRRAAESVAEEALAAAQV